jgi:pre-mRNA-splicing factor 18
MDFLKSEIASKRKTLDTTTDARPAKYMRKGDVARLKEEEERKAREDKERAAVEAAQSKKTAVAALRDAKVCAPLLYALTLS